MWFTTDPWTPTFLLLACAAVCIVLGVVRQQKKFFVIALGFAVLIGLTFLVDAFVHTPEEQVAENVVDLVRDFEENRMDEVIAHFSPRVMTPEREVMLRGTRERIEIPEPLRVSDVRVTMIAQGTRAESYFRVNGSVRLDNADQGHRATRWVLTWEEQGGAWRILRLVSVHPISGDQEPNYPVID